MTTPLPIRVTPRLLSILRVLTEAKEPLWGLDITKEAGMPYTTGRPDITRLRQRGWLDLIIEPREGSPARHLYVLTPEAREKAQELLKGDDDEDTEP